MASIPLIENLQAQGTFPLDTRYVAADIAARNAIPAGAVFQGLQVFVTGAGTDGELYIYHGTNGTNNAANWRLAQTSNFNLSAHTTDELTEGNNNLYYTDGRADGRARARFTDAEKTKLAGITAGAEPNVGETFTVAEQT